MFSPLYFLVVILGVVSCVTVRVSNNTTPISPEGGRAYDDAVNNVYYNNAHYYDDRINEDNTAYYNAYYNNGYNNGYSNEYDRVIHGGTGGHNTRKGHGHYSHHPGHHGTYHHGGSSHGCFPTHPMLDSLLHIGAAKLGLVGLLKASASSIGTSLLTQVPYFLLKLFVKFIFFKIAALFIGVPFLFPVFVMYLPHLVNKFSSCCEDDDDDDDDHHNNNNNNTTSRGQWETGDYAKAVGRAMRTFVNAERCYERMACEFATNNATSEYNRPTMRVLELMLKSGKLGERKQLESFKKAYLTGMTTRASCDTFYKCDFHKVITNLSK